MTTESKALGTTTLRQKVGMIGLIMVMLVGMMAVMPATDASALPPPNNSAPCKKLVHTSHGLAGGSHHCYYAVTVKYQWRSWCNGRGGTWSLRLDCLGLPGGHFKVDVWKTDPWTWDRSYDDYYKTR